MQFYPTALRKALNRERAHVGRSAYTDRVKAILLECSQAQVAEALAQDLKNFETGKIHDELRCHTECCVGMCPIVKRLFLTRYAYRISSPLGML
jgi:predicted amidohydrolase